MQNGKTECIKDLHPSEDDEVGLSYDSSVERERSLLEQFLMPREVDVNGYRYFSGIFIQTDSV